MVFLIMGRDHQGQMHSIGRALTAAEAKVMRDELEGYAEVLIYGPSGLMTQAELESDVQPVNKVGPV